VAERPPSAVRDEVRTRSAKQLEGKDPEAVAAERRSYPDQVVKIADLAATPVPTLGIVGTADPYSGTSSA
jgi:hypothetical protein